MSKRVTHRLVQRWLACWVLLILPVSLFAASNTETPLVVRGWTPTLTLAGAPPIEPAIDLIQRTLALNKVALYRTELDPELEKLSDSIVASLSKFDLAGLHHKLPEQQGERHSLAIAGQPGTDHYTVTRIPTDTMKQPLTTFGQSYQLISMQPKSTAHGTAYAMRMAGQVNVDQVGWDSVTEAFHHTLTNLANAAPDAPPSKALQAVSAMNNKLAADEQQILAQFYTAFPSTADWFMSIGELTDFYADKQPRAQAKHMHMVFTLDPRRLKANYPAVASYLKKLGNFLTASVLFTGVDGDWLNVDLDTSSLTAKLDFWIANGYPVPSLGSYPALDKTLTEIPQRLNWNSELALTARAFGVTVDLSKILSRWEYQKTEYGAHTRGIITTKPNVQVKGRYFGIFPSGMVEKLSPITVAGTVDDFMSVFIASNNRGATLDIDYNDSGSKGSILTAETNLDALDNFFIRLGMGMVSKRVIPSPAQADDMRKMAGDALASYEADFTHWSPILLSEQAAIDRSHSHTDREPTTD